MLDVARDTEVQPVAPRPRTRIVAPLDPNAPPPLPSHPAKSRWPNGAMLTRQGGGPENHYGWQIDEKVWRRTGPNDDDIAFLGKAKDTSEAFALFKGKTWADGRPKGRVRASRTDVRPDEADE